MTKTDFGKLVNAFGIRFVLILQWLLGIEGVDSDDADDPGGRTRYGIAQRYWPDVDVPNLTIVGAAKIYFEHYWLKYQCDKLPPALGVALFGAVVNQSGKKSIAMLQETLRVKPDGFMGPQTIAAAQTCDLQFSVPDFLSRRALYYHYRCIENPRKEKFYRGWMRRLFRLQAFIYREKRIFS